MPDRTVTAFGPPAYLYECPRWHDGQWWVSDMRGGTVYRLSPEGEARVVVEIEGRPAGLGWTPEGRLLVVSMEDKRLLQVDPGSGAIERVHDLAGLVAGTEGFLNDLTVSPSGHAYIGFDADYFAYGADAELGKILHVTPQGKARVAAEGLAFPNGIVIAPGGGSLVVAETLKPRLTRFALGPDGTLAQRGIWGEITDPPTEAAVRLDGFAMDAQGMAWIADVGSGCLRIAPGGAVVEAIFLPDGLRPFACTLGGPDGRTLMICGAEATSENRTARRGSRLFTAQVDIGVDVGAAA